MASLSIMYNVNAARATTEVAVPVLTVAITRRWMSERVFVKDVVIRRNCHMSVSAIHTSATARVTSQILIYLQRLDGTA